MMPLRLRLVLFYLALIILPAYASSSMDLFQRAHKYALRHTFGLVRDIRIAFQGSLAVRDVSENDAAQKVMCVRPANPLAPTGEPTSPAKTAPSATISTAIPSSTSAYKLQALYVRLVSVKEKTLISVYNTRRRETHSLTDGLSGQLLIRPPAQFNMWIRLQQ